MKKKIFLVLLAVLLCTGLIIGCGSDDKDDPFTPPGPDDPVQPTVTYTVTFDPDGNTFEDNTTAVKTVTVNSGSTVGAAKWPDLKIDNEEVLSYAWQDGATEYKYNTAITKDVTLKPVVVPRPNYIDLGGFTTERGKAGQAGWASAGLDQGVDLEWGDFVRAKYLVFHTRGGSSTSGFGAIQVIYQGDGNSFAWEATVLAATTITRDADKDVFIAIDLSKIKTYATFIAGTQGKVVFQYSNVIDDLGLKAGYFARKALAKPAEGAVELVDGDSTVCGFVTDADILELGESELEYNTVTFDVAGGVAIPARKVGKGKAIGVQYPYKPKKTDYVFEGWYDSGLTTPYTAETPITADTTFYADWTLYVWDGIPNTEKLADDGSLQWSIKDALPFTYFIVASKGGGSGSAYNAGGFGGMQVGMQANNSAQKIYSTGNWLVLNHGEEETVYFIFDLSTWDNYSTVCSADNYAQFRYNYGGDLCLGMYQGYIVDASIDSLTKPEGAVDYADASPYAAAAGFATKTLPIELQ